MPLRIRQEQQSDFPAVQALLEAACFHLADFIAFTFFTLVSAKNC